MCRCLLLVLRCLHKMLGCPSPSPVVVLRLPVSRTWWMPPRVVRSGANWARYCDGKGCMRRTLRCGAQRVGAANSPMHPCVAVRNRPPRRMRSRSASQNWSAKCSDRRRAPSARNSSSRFKKSRAAAGPRAAAAEQAVVIAAVVEFGVRCGVRALCTSLSLAPATYYRTQQRARQKPVVRPPVSPARTLSAREQADVLAVLHEDRFVDCAPAQVYATLLDEGTYHCSERTMYRVLTTHAEVRERRAQRRHPHYTAPELLATRSNQLWS